LNQSIETINELKEKIAQLEQISNTKSMNEPSKEIAELLKQQEQLTKKLANMNMNQITPNKNQSSSSTKSSKNSIVLSDDEDVVVNKNIKIKMDTTLPTFNGKTGDNGADWLYRVDRILKAANCSEKEN